MKKFLLAGIIALAVSPAMAEECLYGRSTITGWCLKPPVSRHTYSYEWYTYTVPANPCNTLPSLERALCNQGRRISGY
jgi:hypothetical protein